MKKILSALALISVVSCGSENDSIIKNVVIEEENNVTDVTDEEVLETAEELDDEYENAQTEEERKNVVVKGLEFLASHKIEASAVGAGVLGLILFLQREAIKKGMTAGMDKSKEYVNWIAQQVEGLKSKLTREEKTESQSQGEQETANQ